ncbi:hypothetical protein Sjap_019962 [Stephania japonica]|uniref:Uncharacterized protein n=1 Tax=Stephania japonica TaxID=461633 RepID=A0AAP0F545_9MAGN
MEESRLRAIIETQIISITTLMAQREAWGLSPLGFKHCPLDTTKPVQIHTSQSSEDLPVLRILKPSPPEDVLAQCGINLRKNVRPKTAKGESSTSKEVRRLAWNVNEVPDRIVLNVGSLMELDLGRSSFKVLSDRAATYLGEV